MDNVDEDYGDDCLAIPTFVPIKPITRDDNPPPETPAAYSKELAVVKGALPKDDLEDFNFATEVEDAADRRTAALDFSFRFKKRISTNRNRYARDSYEVLIGRPSDDAAAKTPVAVEVAAPAAAAPAPARARLKIIKKETPRPLPTPVAAPSSSSSSDDDYGFGRLAFMASSSSTVAPAAESADAMSLVTWEHDINWQGSCSGSGSEDDTGTHSGSGKLFIRDSNQVCIEYDQLLAAKVSSHDSSDPTRPLSCMESAAPKPEPLTLRNHALLSCQWLDNVQWVRQRRAKGSARTSSAHGQMTISRRVRLPDEPGLKKLLCVSVDDFYSVNLHPLKNQRSRLGVDHSAYAKSFKGLSMNVSRYTALISHLVHPPFLCWNCAEGQDTGAAMYFETLNDREGFRQLPPKLPSEEEDSTQALKELSEAHHFTCIKGPIAIIEHFQEPMYLSSVGMCLRMVAYKKSSTDVPAHDDDPTNYTWQNSEDMRSASFFTDLPDEVPCIKTIQNNMCTAPVVFHRKPSKHRAFLLVCRDGRMFLREVRGVHLAGQQLPLEKVETIRQPEGYRFQLNRMLLRLNEECPPHEWARKPLPVDEVLNLCGQEKPENNQQFITFMKSHFQRELQENEFGEKDKTSTEWIWGKAGVDTAKVHQLMRPETACLLRAAYVGEASLRFSLVDDKLRHMDGLHKTHEAIQLHASHRDQDLVKRVYEALKRAPWTLTRSYLEKVQSGFLVWSGLGLYVKIDRSKFVNAIGGKNMSTHLNEERKKFLEKMLEAYTIENESDAKGPEQLRHYLLRRNNALLQMRDETTFVGGAELPSESRRSVNANHRKLMEDIHAAYLGFSNPYDLHRHHVPPPSRGSRGSKAKGRSISTASRKRKQDEWNSDDSSSSESSVTFDEDWLSDMDGEAQQDAVEEDGNGWVEDSPPPPVISKFVIKRPVMSPVASTPATPARTNNTPVSSSGEDAVLRQRSYSAVDSALQDGLQAVLYLMTKSNHLKTETFAAFDQPVSLKEFKDYSKVIKRPKCIQDIVASIRANVYNSCDDFLSDVMLISSNCEAFSRSIYFKYDEDLVLAGWGLFVKVSGCFFKQYPAAIDLLDTKTWSVQQRSIFKIHALDFEHSDFIFRVDKALASYYKVVKKPVCLSEIQMHAASAAASVASVAEKVLLMCSNCRLFCGTPQGAEYASLLPKVDKILEMWGGLGCAPSVAPSPVVFRIKSSGSSSFTGRSPLSLASDVVKSSDAVLSSSTFSSTPRTPLPPQNHPSGSLGYYVERLADEFPDFVPDLKYAMIPATYKAYKQKVKQPMSLSQVRQKLQQGMYSSAQFLADVQTIGSNCVLFWDGIDAGLVNLAHAFMRKGAAYSIEYDQQVEAQQTAAAATAATPISAAGAEEPPKKKITLSLKRSGSAGSGVSDS